MHSSASASSCSHSPAGGRNGSSARSPVVVRSGPFPDALHRAATPRADDRCAPLRVSACKDSATSFEQRYAQRHVERRLHERNIFAHELLLQRDRAGREHDLLAAANCRHEIGERLADAGSGFDDRVHALQDAALDELRHLHLAGARFKVRRASVRANGPFRRPKIGRRGCVFAVSGSGAASTNGMRRGGA